MTLLPANVPQHPLAQGIRVALPGLGKGNEFVGDGTSVHLVPSDPPLEEFGFNS
jgi:hypothetical protein